MSLGDYLHDITRTWKPRHYITLFLFVSGWFTSGAGWVNNMFTQGDLTTSKETTDAFIKAAIHNANMAIKFEQKCTGKKKPYVYRPSEPVRRLQLHKD